MELSRSDLLRLLSILEGELQAREIVIAVLKAEQIKKLLYPMNKFSVKSSFGSKTIKLNENFNSKPNDSNDSNLVEYCDPWNALSRDAFGAYDPSFDKTTTIALFNMKMTQLEALITQQRTARNVLKDQLKIIESKYNSIVEELDREKRLNETKGQKSGQTSDSGNIKLETELKTMAQTLENERNREKQIVLCLLSERKQLIIKLIEERQRNEELLHLLSSEKGKIAEMVEGLEDESKRSLQMEAELEKYLNDFEGEREKFRNQLSASETRNAELAAEVDRLRQQLNGKQNNSLNLGEGVRSAIVTMTSATRCVPTVPSVSTVSQPRASVAQHVTTAKSLPNANSSPNQSSVLKSKSPVSAHHSYATVQPISSVKMNATIPPPPSVPAPPPKALISNSKSTPNPVSQTTKLNAFQNMTYNLEPIPSNAGNPSALTGPTPPSLESNNSINSRVEKTNITSAKVMVESSQTASSRESSSVQSPLHPNQSNPSIQRKLSASGAGRGTPPPIPPNKPIIKPVLPPQALQQRSKDLNSTKVMTASVGSTPAKIVSAVNSTTNANTPTNSIKNTTINSSDSTAGEQNNGPKNKPYDGSSPSNSSDTTSVDILCQELENFNSLLVSMVSTASQKNS